MARFHWTLHSGKSSLTRLLSDFSENEPSLSHNACNTTRRSPVDTVVIDVFLLRFHSSLSVLPIPHHLCRSHFVTSLHYPLLSPSFSLSLTISQWKAVRGFLRSRWAVKSHKLLLLYVWLGEWGRERQNGREERGDFLLQHFWTVRTSTSTPITHKHVHMNTHSCNMPCLPSSFPLGLRSTDKPSPPSTHIVTHPCSHSTTPSHFALQFRSLHWTTWQSSLKRDEALTMQLIKGSDPWVSLGSVCACVYVYTPVPQPCILFILIGDDFIIAQN